MKTVSQLCFNPFSSMNTLLSALQHCGGHFVHMEPPYLVGLWQVPPHSSLCSGWHSSESSLPPWTFTSSISGCLHGLVSLHCLGSDPLPWASSVPILLPVPLHCQHRCWLCSALPQYFKTGFFRKGRERKEMLKKENGRDGKGYYFLKKK